MKKLLQPASSPISPANIRWLINVSDWSAMRAQEDRFAGVGVELGRGHCFSEGDITITCAHNQMKKF